MSKPRVFVARQVFQEALDMISAEADLEVWTDEMPPSREVLLKKVSGVDGLLSLLTDKIDGELMDAAPNLRAISQIAVGYENIDIAEATSRGIPVGYTPGVLTGTTADMAFALLMAEKVSEIYGSDWGIGETGAAGPTGNGYGDPPGYSCLAVYGERETSTHVLTNSNNRRENMEAFALAALDLFIKNF